MIFIQGGISLSNYLNVLSIGFDKNDNSAMERSFSDDGMLRFADSVNNYQEAIEKFHSLSPNVVVINIRDNPAEGITAIRSIYDVSNKNNPPLILVAYYTEETNLLNDPIAKELSSFCYFYKKYGNGHSIEDIIEGAYNIAV